MTGIIVMRWTLSIDEQMKYCCVFIGNLPCSCPNLCSHNHCMKRWVVRDSCLELVE